MEDKKINATFTIDKETIKKDYDRRIRQVAEKFSAENITSIIHKLESILNNPPSVVNYKNVADDLTKDLNKYYNIVGGPNLFHHPIKDIDLNIYGRAENFMDKVGGLLSVIYEVAETMKEMGKLKEIKHSNRIIIICDTSKDDTEIIPTFTNWLDRGLIKVNKWERITNENE